MYVLYGGKFTRALLVQMVLDEGDIPYELCEINFWNANTWVQPFVLSTPQG